jgi:phenylacetate-coenzyme A ligase PaaK-like adenylate-forming protein
VTNIESRVLDFIGQPGGETEFNDLALAVFAYQYEHVPVYRRFCERRGAEPGCVARWEDVPALPADAFKHGLDAAERRHVFLSSGTAAGPEQRSRHTVESLAAYEASALTQFRAMVLADEPGPLATLVLGPTAVSHSNSSLGACSAGASTFAQPRLLVAFDADGRATSRR